MHPLARLPLLLLLTAHCGSEPSPAPVVLVLQGGTSGSGGMAGAAGETAEGGQGGVAGAAGQAGAGSAGGEAGASGAGNGGAGAGTGGGAGAAGGGGQAGAGGKSPGSCKNEGGRSCGAPIGGEERVLYLCDKGQWIAEQDCGGPCEALPPGVPDRCASDVVAPDALVETLSVQPYVEGDCTPTTWDGWPHEAKKCTYTAGGITTTVTTATPGAKKVATWIVDAAVFVPSLWKIRITEPSSWLAGLKEFALQTLYQSSRIFPLEGGIIENMGSGYVNYPFFKGVTQGCSSGCYCRINSLHRTDWCGFQAFLKASSYDACIAKVGGSGLTKAWGEQCLQNHIDAWTSTSNQHFRARAWQINQTVSKTCPGVSCSGPEVVAAIKQAFQ